MSITGANTPIDKQKHYRRGTKAKEYACQRQRILVDFPLNTKVMSSGLFIYFVKLYALLSAEIWQDDI